MDTMGFSRESCTLERTREATRYHKFMESGIANWQKTSELKMDLVSLIGEADVPLPC